jgi:hypothetical protein
MNPVTHFVGFRGEEFHSAVRVFGYPHFFHRWWDVRAWQEVAPGDTVVFATGDENQSMNPYTFDDSSVVAGNTDQVWDND